VARDAAAKALGPPRVTVEPDPDVRDEPDSVNDGVGRRLRTVLGVSATDRPGLLHDISQGLNRLRVQLLHCEASVVANRSVSIWRLQSMDQSTTREEIRTVIEALLSPTSGSQASKEKGQSVLRVRVRSGGALVGRASADVNFRATYGAAIVAMQRGGRAPDGKLGQVKLREGDVLVLQCNEDSPLLKDAPADFLEENRLDAGKDESRDESFVSVPQKGTPGGGSTPANMPSTPHGSRSSLMSMVGMKDLGMKDLRGYSLRSRGAQQSKTELDKNDANLSVGAEVSVTVEKEPPSTASSGGSSGSGSNDVSANDVSVAIPDIRGLSLRSPVAQTVTPKPAEDDADEKAAGASRLAVRKAHRDLEIIGAANDEAGKEFLIAVRVERRSQFIKKTADEAGLRQLPGLFLVSIERHKSDAAAESGSPAIPTNDAATKEETSTNEPGSLPHPVDASTMNATLVKPSVSSEVFSSTKKEDQKDDASSVTVVDPSDDKLLEDDVLWYAGNAASVSSLRKIPGLAPYSADQVDKLSNVNSQERRLIQAVVAKTGPLVGKSIREIKFRTRYNAVVLAVHREGARVHARVGDVILHPGDVLLLDAGPDFHREAGHSGSGFALVSVLEDSAPPRLRLLVPVLAIAVAMIAVYSAGVTELLVAAIFAAAIMIACGALSEQEARDAIKWDVIVTIAAAFGMSKALQNSGVAGIIAERLVSLAKVSGTGRVGLLTAVYFATFLISNVVTNNAAAALMFPIAAEAAEKAGETLQSVSFLVMLAASASFMSPFGYQTNLMVYGPGGYVFKDFLRFGVPMQVVQLVVSVAVIGIGGKFWWVSWGSTAIAFGVTCAMMMWEKSPAEYARECLRAVPAAARGRRAAAEEEPSTGSRRRV
jgi:Trk K+ transport system NAD-binding subunit